MGSCVLILHINKHLVFPKITFQFGFIHRKQSFRHSYDLENMNWCVLSEQNIFFFLHYKARTFCFLLNHNCSVSLEGKSHFYALIFLTWVEESATFVFCSAICPEGTQTACCCFIRCRVIFSLSLVLGLSPGCPPRECCRFTFSFVCFLTFFKKMYRQGVQRIFGASVLPSLSMFADEGNQRHQRHSWVCYAGNYGNWIGCWPTNSKRCKVSNPKIVPAHEALKVNLQHFNGSQHACRLYDCILSRQPLWIIPSLAVSWKTNGFFSW